MAPVRDCRSWRRSGAVCEDRRHCERIDSDQPGMHLAGTLYRGHHPELAVCAQPFPDRKLRARLGVVARVVEETLRLRARGIERPRAGGPRYAFSRHLLSRPKLLRSFAPLADRSVRATRYKMK